MFIKSNVIFIILSLFVLTGCQGTGGNGGQDPPVENYISFSQSVQGLITGMTDINGNLKVTRQNFSSGTDIPVTHGTFTITADHKLKAETVEIMLTTDEGLTIHVMSAQLGESNLTYKDSNRLIDTIIEKEEAMRTYLGSGSPKQLSDIERMMLNWQDYCRTEILPAKKKALERLEEKLNQTLSVSTYNRLEKSKNTILEDISRIESGELTLMDAYTNCNTLGSFIWLKPPTIVIYDQSVWNWANQRWTRKPGLDSQIESPLFAVRAKNFYFYTAYQYFQGLTNVPFTILKESAGDQMPDPNLEVSGEDDPRYIFFIINDNPYDYNIYGGFTYRAFTHGFEVTKSFASAPYHCSYDRVWGGNMWLMAFMSLNVADTHFIGFSCEDGKGNVTPLMKLLGKIKNTRDQGHAIREENGEYIEKTY